MIGWKLEFTKNIKIPDYEYKLIAKKIEGYRGYTELERKINEF
jgi:hypothetical protein